MEAAGSRGLIRTALASCSCNDNEKIEDDPEQGHAENNRCDSYIDLPQVTREGPAKKQ